MKFQGEHDRRLSCSYGIIFASTDVTAWTCVDVSSSADAARRPRRDMPIAGVVIKSASTDVTAWTCVGVSSSAGAARCPRRDMPTAGVV